MVVSLSSFAGSVLFLEISFGSDGCSLEMLLAVSVTAYTAQMFVCIHVEMMQSAVVVVVATSGLGCFLCIACVPTICELFAKTLSNVCSW